jgi:tRNA(Ile)-lysidine synthase TilS/MesJ
VDTLNKRDRPICKRCVLPESLPDIRLDPDGVCNICLEHEAAHQDYDAAPPLETDFTRIIEKHRGKHRYDCLVMCSGGKDSTSALYYMKKRYKMNPLAFTFDHGFETEDALANIHRAVEILDVDFLQYRSTYIRDMMSHLLKTGSRAVICHMCSIWYMDLTFRIAARFKIPIIIAGWTKGQSTSEENENSPG